MFVLMIAHVGETLGHLVRGLAIADELTDHGVRVEIAASREAEWLLRTWQHPYTHHIVRWGFSHNSCDPHRPSSFFLRRVLDANADVLELLRTLRPDLILSFPGIITTQAARSLGIPHVSVLHGPYLSPLVSLEDVTQTEARVIEFATEIFYGGCVDKIYSYLSQELGMPELTYKEYLHTERIFVPQEGLPLLDLPNIHQMRFIRASFGPPFHSQQPDLSEACFVTFGSGNPCDITRIVQLAHTVFPLVIVSTGCTQLRSVPKGVVTSSFIASSSLAGRVKAVISHGGIGTVGTFAEHGTPQLIIPTEPDQAAMAVHGARLGVARYCGLDSWAEKPQLGRRLPDFHEEELVYSLQALRLTSMCPDDIVSSGASDIADGLVKEF